MDGRFRYRFSALNLPISPPRFNKFRRTYKAERMAVPVTHRNITWRVHEASKRIRENHERQRAIIHAQNRSQLKIERDVVASRIDRKSVV